MSLVLLAPPDWPEPGSSDPILIAAAPAAPESERGWLAALLPGLSALGMLGFALLSPNVLVIALTGSVAILSAAAAVWAARRQRRRRDEVWHARRARYLAHLGDRSRLLSDAARRQRAYAVAAYPPPALVDTGSETAPGAGWGRRTGAVGSPKVRIGTGRVAARRPPQLANAGGDPDGDAELLAASVALATRYGAVDGLPITLDLAAGDVTVITGDRMPLLRAILLSLTRGYGPDEVRLHAWASLTEQDWLRRLPHAGCVTADPAELLQALRPEADSGPFEVVILAGGALPVDELLHRVAAEAHSRGPRCVLVLLDTAQSVPAQADRVLSDGPDGSVTIHHALAAASTTTHHPTAATSVARPDAISFPEALRFAQLMEATQRPAPPFTALDSPRLQSLLTTTAPHPLRLPIGCDDDGLPVVLDLQESASGGDGPHGLIVGATGSGKSELLRTLLIAAAHQSPPEELAFLLVDYKGGAAFAELGRLPHTAGLLTNLTADPQGVTRFCASLRAELRRRQRALLAAGVDDIRAYRKVQVAGAHPIPPMPRLLVVIDEYAELIEESPESLDILTSIGRLGRSLGVHLLLSSQRLDDGRLRGLEAHLRFRICLRTFSAAESVSVIGSPVAAQLPARPGLAWLRRDGSLTKLRVALIGDPAEAVNALITRLGAAAAATGRSVRCHPPICLPPLPDMLTLQPPSAEPLTAEHSPGEHSHAGTDRTRRLIELGLVDVPDSGEQRPLTLDLGGHAAHLALAGAPRSGRSTGLASVVAALARVTSPRDLAVHIVTSGTSILSGLSGLPHVGTIATTPELQAGVLRAVAAEVAQRQAGQGGSGHILLVIDGVGEVLGADDGLSADLVQIATRGLSVGVSIAVSCHRWTELRGGLREAIGTRWELRLNDPGDSSHPALRRGGAAAERPVPGRVITNDGLWAQLALPRIDELAETAGLADAMAKLVATVARRGGPPTKPIQLLPLELPLSALPQAPRAGRLAIGVSGSYAEPADIALGRGDHLVVLGNGGSGRSSLLRAVGSVVTRWGARLWVIDPRGALASLQTSGGRHAARPSDITDLLTELTAELARRLDAPASGKAPASERHPAEVLLIDDLDLVGLRIGTAAFAPLADLLGFARDVGLSVVAARRVTGSNRASYDPFFGRLTELCETAVVLSGDAAEGLVLGGIRPRPRPPGRGQLVLRGELAGDIHVVSVREPNCAPEVDLATPSASRAAATGANRGEPKCDPTSSL